MDFGRVHDFSFPSILCDQNDGATDGMRTARNDMLRSRARSEEQKGCAMNPKTLKPASAMKTAENHIAPQQQAKEPQCKDQDAEQRYVIGLDLSDRTAHLAVLGPVGEDGRAEKKIQLNRESLRRQFADYAGSLLVMEVGTQSRWVQPALAYLG
jgi:hypothetical protein